MGESFLFMGKGNGAFLGATLGMLVGEIAG
jgi:hypothetical protein